jgi:hypothetical protein
MGALTLTSLTELIYVARDQVAQEPAGFLRNVMNNSEAAAVSINGTVTSIRTSEPTLNTSVTPSMTPPEGDDQTIAAETLTLDKVASVQIPLTGENRRKLENIGQYGTAWTSMIAQAMRKIRNQIESDVGVALKNGSSRATGTAGTTPFASNMNIIGDVRQILVDNGTPDDGDWALVMNTSAGTKLRQLANLYKVNEAGSEALRARGALLDIFGFGLFESRGVASHTKGTGTSYQVNQTGLTTGSTSVTLDTGSGTIVAGDSVTFASGTGSGYNYIVKTGIAAAGTAVLNFPGLRGNIADNNALTIGNDYTANIGFHRSAVELAMRPYDGIGDGAIDRMTVVDPVTGMAFEIAIYGGYKKSMIDISTVYGVKVWKPEYVATMFG